VRVRSTGSLGITSTRNASPPAKIQGAIVAKETVSYDPEVIQEFARRLYQRARTITLMYALVGLLVGFAVALAVLALTQHGKLENNGVMGIAAIVGALFGYFAGTEKAFKLRLEAQQALCQIEIEKNSRCRSLQPV
jgi:hypothetical protein